MLNFIWNCWTLFLKWMHHFTFSSAVCKSSSCSTSLGILGSVSLLNFSHSSSSIIVFLVRLLKPFSTISHSASFMKSHKRKFSVSFLKVDMFLSKWFNFLKWTLNHVIICCCWQLEPNYNPSFENVVNLTQLFCVCNIS